MKNLKQINAVAKNLEQNAQFLQNHISAPVSTNEEAYEKTQDMDTIIKMHELFMKSIKKHIVNAKKETLNRI